MAPTGLITQGDQSDSRNLRVLLGLCAMYYDYGDPAALEGAAVMFRRAAERSQRPVSIAWANSLLGWVHYQRNDLAAAGRYFSSVVNAPGGAHIRAVLEAYAGIVLTQCAKTQWDQAHAAANELAAWLAEHQLAGLYQFADALAIWIDLASHDASQSRSIPLAEGLIASSLELWVMPRWYRHGYGCKTHIRAI
ncbi:MAG: hypothetical protein IPK16_23460 [Anaerolineales bacterium]|nr:hypothetical protein [Anaerolineales bacterium]